MRKLNSRDQETDSLAMFACPNEDCSKFNVFGAGNLSVCERMGRDKQIRRLYCNHCGHRFSERQGSLMAKTKLPQETVIRIVKCLSHACSIEATADICDVDPRTVELLLTKGGQRAHDFQRSALEELDVSPGVVEVDELHAAVSGRKKGNPIGKLALLSGKVLAAVGFTSRWP